MESDEKRDFPRMSINCSMEYIERGSKQSELATALNISSTGILFESDRLLATGDLIEVKVPANLPISTLKAIVRVARVETGDAVTGFRIAGIIEQKLD